MKATRFLDLAAASRSLFFAGATRALIILGLLLLPFMVGSGVDFMSGSFAYAEKPPGVGGGKPDPSPGSGGQGPPDQPPGGGDGKPDKPGRGSGDLYSELVFVYRSVDGLPIFVGVPEGVEEEEELLLAEGFVACEQPITGFPIVEGEASDYIDTYVGTTFPNLTNPLTNPANGRDVSPVPLGGTGLAGEECDVQTEPYLFIGFAEEVHFGRMNVGRSPEKVLRRQLGDVENTLKLGVQRWDVAGRISMILGTEELAIDSPLQSLAIYQSLMETGKVGTHPWLSDLPWTDTDELDYAASALGAAADKGEWFVVGDVNLDLVVYNNRILNIPSDTVFLPTIEGDGDTGVLNELYIDYGDDFYSYDRTAKYPGCFAGISTSGVIEGFILDWVFDPNVVIDDVEEFPVDNIYGFAIAADDSRRVISFSHSLVGAAFDRAGEVVLCCELGLLEGEACPEP